ncbi:hypothetical protein GTP41_12490 [Pseudoduganella sp. DS3]|uniref:Uncharacterized protein n=1 Tax=Pseudoduganella guangdongensis TaxID=2692179 RepID=A0A6N9HHU5_9BURK|nr:hypothetical protein [Pseudoduganella guangdongensis]MYN02919.1 hypothetical protein [Pseudoduganella guangdongensis]
MRLDSEKLHVIASAPRTSENCRRVARALCAAMNDWPTENLTLVNAFIRELEACFSPLTFENIEAVASRINSATDAWKAEGLAVLLEAWGINDRHKTLNELLGELQRESANE